MFFSKHQTSKQQAPAQQAPAQQAPTQQGLTSTPAVSEPPPIRRLLLTRSLWDEILHTCSSEHLESGGKALGRFYADGVAIACLHIGPGPRAERSAVRFQPDIPYQQACYEGLLRQFPNARLALDYHSHPGGPPHLSGVDHNSISRLLGPEGWGIDALTFMVLSPGRQGLEPHAFFGQRSSQDGGSHGSGVDQIEVHPIEVALISDDDPRVQQLLSPTVTTLKVIVPVEVQTDIAQRLEASQTETVPLFGYQRLEEGLIQVLSTRPLLDAYPVGRAVTVGGASTPPQERELRLTWGNDGPAAAGVRAEFVLGGLPVGCQLEHPALQSDLHKRNGGLVDAQGLAACHVAFVGLGSVGAPIALALANAGVGRFTLMDPDTFSASNVARHPGDVRALGRRKDVLLKEMLLARNPALTVDCLASDVRDPADLPALETHLVDADLIVVSTDDPTANLAANRLALELDRPALFVGVYDEGLGGELFVRRPNMQGSPRAGCYNCVAGFRSNLPPIPRGERAHDYLNLRAGSDLPPLHALGIDISHIVSLASSIGLGLLGESARLEGLIDDTPLLLINNGKRGWIFSHPFEVIPARLDPPGCPVCDSSLIQSELEDGAQPRIESSDFVLSASDTAPWEACLIETEALIPMEEDIEDDAVLPDDGLEDEPLFSSGQTFTV